MKDIDIQFYGERGIVNGILLDIYQDDNPKDKLDKFFGAIKLVGAKKLPWKGIDSCKWMVEPSFAQFGDPDLIAVIESNRETYALFIEAKLKDYVSSCMSLQREDGIDNLKGQSSKLNVQLSFRYRFVQALKETPKDASKIIIERHGGEYPDRQQRKLQKEPVVDSISSFLEGVEKKNIYFIALTNDVSPKKGLKEMEDDYCPPLTLTLKNGTCNEFVNNKSNFGILTYRELVANDVVKYDEKEKEGLGFFHKACKMMGVVPVANTSRSHEKNDSSHSQTDSPSNVDRINSIKIKKWDKDLKTLAKDFTDSKDLQFRFNTLSGSYSLKVGNEVIMKLMQYQPLKCADKQLMLGLLDSSVFNAKKWKGKEGQALSVGGGEHRKIFYFYPVKRDKLNEMIKLANKYYKSWLGIPEPIYVWQDIPEEGIKGTLSGLQYNTGLWMSQVTEVGAEDLEEPNDKIPLCNELRLLVITEKENEKREIEIVIANLPTSSLYSLGSVQNNQSYSIMLQPSITENNGYELSISPKINTSEKSPVQNTITCLQQIKWRDIE